MRVTAHIGKLVLLVEIVSETWFAHGEVAPSDDMGTVGGDDEVTWRLGCLSQSRMELVVTGVGKVEDINFSK